MHLDNTRLHLTHWACHVPTKSQQTFTCWADRVIVKVKAFEAVIFKE